MKRLAAVALIVAGLMLPAFAQRAGSRGGFSGRTGQAFHGGTTASAPRSAAPHRFAGASGFPGGRAVGIQPGMAHGFRGGGYARGGPGNSPDHRDGGRRDHRDGDHHRRPYVSPYGTGLPYGFAPWGGWIGPGYPGYGDAGYQGDSGTGSAPAAQGDAVAGGGYDTPPQEQDQAAPRHPYQPSAELSRPAPAPAIEEAVTIVFKDGRPAEQIHNYVLTRSTLYIQDQHRRSIPIDQLDLAATGKANHDAGIDFQLPSGSE